MNDKLLRLVLNEIEKREMPLLSWGVTNGSMSETEMELLIRSVAPEEDPEEIIDALDTGGLIVSKGIGKPRYCSRMAETVRLATSLRQWFHGQPWSSARTLVSDARFLSSPRVVPRRDLPASRLLDDLKSLLGSDWTPRYNTGRFRVLSG